MPGDKNQFSTFSHMSSRQLPGRDQLLLLLLLKSPELQNRLGKRYCDESELLPLLLSHGLVGRVRAIGDAVRPLGGENFKVTCYTGLREAVGGGGLRRRSLVCRGLKRLGRSFTGCRCEQAGE
jgi:hypothetical protein